VDDLVGKILALFFSLLIFGNAYLIRRIVGTWVFPACIYSLFWFVYTFIPMVFVIEAPVEPLSIVYIFTTTITFSLGSFVFKWKPALRKNQFKTSINDAVFDNYFLKSIFYLSSATSVIFVILNSIMQNITLNDLIFDLFKSSAKYTEMRYSEEVKVNIYGQLSLILSYIAAVLGGLIYRNQKEWKSKFTVIITAFISAVIIMVTQSAKGTFIFAIFSFLAGLLVVKIYKNEKSILSVKDVKSAVICIIVSIVLFAVSFMSRGLYESNDISFVIGKLTLYFNSYAFAHVFAFSDWFSYYLGNNASQEYEVSSMSFGFYTFMALFRLLGSTKTIPLGVYDEYFVFKDLITSNVYTIYRGLILDFTILGSLVFMLVLGFIFHWFFFAMLINKKPHISTAIFIIMVLFAQNGQVISMLIWNNVYIFFAILSVIFFINNRCIPTHITNDKTGVKE